MKRLGLGLEKSVVYISAMPLNASLHWLRVPERIEYKVAVLTYNVLNGSAPQYLGPLVPVADLPGRRTLRSAGTNRLLVPPVRLSSFDSR